MHVPVKMFTGVWENAKNNNPLQFQFVADPTRPWKDVVLEQLRSAIRNLEPNKVNIDGYYANPHEILVCDTWEQVTDLFYSIRIMLLRDDDKQFTLTFEGKDEKFHLYVRNF